MTDKRDLLMHYDEENQKFIFYSVETESTAGLRAKAFGGVSPDVATFKQHPPEEAERMLGAMVFSLLDLGAANKVKIRDYEAEAEVINNEWLAEAEVAGSKGDPEAQYDVYMHLHSRALKSRNLDELQRAEEMLFASAKAGYAHAKDALEKWPLLKEAAERRIKRNVGA